MLAKRDVQEPSVPFSGFAADIQKHQVVDNRRVRRAPLLDEEHAGHGLASPQPFRRVVRHSVYIVCQGDPLFFCRPGENLWIWGLHQVDGLCPDDVDLWPAPEQTTYEIVIEVLVGEQPDHERRLVGFGVLTS